jgi:hypothetical protein
MVQMLLVVITGRLGMFEKKMKFSQEVAAAKALTIRHFLAQSHGRIVIL